MKLKLWRSLLLGLCLSNAIAPHVASQIIPDGTTNTTVNSTDNGIRIDEGERTGDNLFHSFEKFSVPNGSEAFFNNSNDIANIFSRVTGGDISNIDGLIRANSDASLFLINPAGIIFGEGASLDLGGSFTASTAESIVFSDDVEFSAIQGNDSPLLTINQPIGLNYGNNPGSIAVNNSNLEVDSGETLALLGGDVTIAGGQIIAPGANIELGGLTQAGQVNFIQLEKTNISSTSFPEGVARGDITLTNGAEVNVQAAGGGNIRVNARNLELGASNLSAGIASESSSTEAQAGDIVLDLTGDIIVDRRSSIFNSVEESAVGNAGGINITTNNLFLNGGQIFTSTFGQGNTGKITLEANGTIEAVGESSEGFPSGIFSRVEEFAIGNSGGIDITTTDLSLTQGGTVDSSTAGQGNTGKITLEANGTIEAVGESSEGFPSGIFSRVEEFAIGNSGGIDITTTNLSLIRGGQISISTFSQGDAGKIMLKANGTIEADGETSEGFASGIFSRIESEAIGDSDGIDITTTDLSLTRGSVVEASTNGQGDAGKITLEANGTIEAVGESSEGFPSGIFSRVEESAVGNSGGIDITTTNLSLTQGGTVDSSTAGQGNTGKITLEANGTIEAVGESSKGFSSGIFSIVEDTGRGNASKINITTTNLSLIRGGQISVSTFSQGDAGKIMLEANDTIEADGETSEGFPSGIFSRIESEAIGDSGGIDITTTDLSLTRGTVVEASTDGQGDAGKITLVANGTIEADGETSEGFPSGIFSIVEDTGRGNAADVSINTLNLSLTNGAEISVESLGQGNAGNLSIKANFLLLKRASLFALTPVGTGGNINLQISDNLTLQDNSTISAQALENANGGNINLEANFVIVQPNQNNDIIAAAAEGTGGIIDITTNAIFGLEERSSIPDNNTNDLDASSELGLDGTIVINELDVNPTEALEELPLEIIDVTGLVKQNLCQQGQGSEFVMTGKGGTAPSPTQARDGSVSEVDLVKPVPFSGTEEAQGAEKTEEAEEIVEAQGWVVNDRGMVELVASKTDIHGSPAHPIVQCHKQ